MLVVWMLMLVASIALSARIGADPMRALVAGVERRHGFWLLGLEHPARPRGPRRRPSRCRPRQCARNRRVGDCVVVLLVTLVSALWDRQLVPPAPAIFMAVVALVWQVTNRGAWLFGTDIQHEFFVANHSRDHRAIFAHVAPRPVSGHAAAHGAPGAAARAHQRYRRDPAATVARDHPRAGRSRHAVHLSRVGLPKVSQWGSRLLFVGVNTALLSELPSITRQCYGLLMFEAMIFFIVLARRPSGRRAC